MLGKLKLIGFIKFKVYVTALLANKETHKKKANKIHKQHVILLDVYFNPQSPPTLNIKHDAISEEKHENRQQAGLPVFDGTGSHQEIRALVY